MSDTIHLDPAVMYQLVNELLIDSSNLKTNIKTSKISAEMPALLAY